MLELFFAFLFLLLIAAAFPFLVLFDTYRSVRTAPRAACAAACDTACNVASKREEQRANPSAPGDLQRCA